MNDTRPPPKASPTPAELVARARALAPTLRQRGAGAAVKAHYFMDIETTRELAGMIRLGKMPFTYIF